jgi:hypothetical protein
MLHQDSQEEEGSSTIGVAAVDTGKKLEKLIKEMLVRGGGGGMKGAQIESDQVKMKENVGC